MHFEPGIAGTQWKARKKHLFWRFRMVVLLLCAVSSCCNSPLDPPLLSVTVCQQRRGRTPPLQDLSALGSSMAYVTAERMRSGDGDPRDWFVPPAQAPSDYSSFHSQARRHVGKQNGLNLFANQLLRYMQDFGHVRVTRNWEPLRMWCQTTGEERVATGLPDGVIELVLAATPTIKRCTNRSQARKRSGPTRAPSLRIPTPLFHSRFPEVPTNLRDMSAFAKLGTWEKKFHLLLRFRMMFGHCHCPFDAKEGWISSLHSWSAQQRKAMKDGTGVLALFPSTAQRLTAAGFSWDPSAENWEGHYQALMLFRMIYGHAAPSKMRARSRERKSLAMFLRRAQPVLRPPVSHGLVEML